jgi:hypothetical protein
MSKSLQTVAFLAACSQIMFACKAQNDAGSKTKDMPGIVEDRFIAPDLAADSTPYTCSFHWFTLEDGRIVGLDVIRSDDTGKLALRAYFEDADHKLQGTSFEANKDEWAPFATEKSNLIESAKNAMGRSQNWIGGSVTAADGSVVKFDLEVTPKSLGLGTGSLGLQVTDLVATDYLEVEYKGTLTIGGETHSIDSLGTASVHYGTRLPLAAYIATVPPSEEPNKDHFLLASANSDNINIGGELFAGKNITYGYSRGILGPVFLSFKRYEKEIPVGLNAHLLLRDVSRFDHTLLGEKTTTGMAKATYYKKAQWPWEQDIERDIGTVVFDYRGAVYIDTLE